MRTSLCSQALNMAIWRRKLPPGLIHYSDRGSQNASDAYRKQFKIFKMTQSMSRKGNCWDNSPTERFFSSLKHEQLNYEKFRFKNSAKLSVIDYLAFYNGFLSQMHHNGLGLTEIRLRALTGFITKELSVWMELQRPCVYLMGSFLTYSHG